MGLSKEQLDDMFPDRMAFSRFQIERVRERNHLTQRLMYEVGMTGTDLTVGINARIAGEKDLEYILVKNDVAEGGWALAVVSKEKDRGQAHKPIDVDALQDRYQAEAEDDEWEDEDHFEDVPIEGLNRLPNLNRSQPGLFDSGSSENEGAGENDESLFVNQVGPTADDLFGSLDQGDDILLEDEDEELNLAIAMSLETQYGKGKADQEEEQQDELEDAPAPQWTQKAVEPSRPITTASGRMVAHIVNNRASGAVPRSVIPLTAAIVILTSQQPWQSHGERRRQLRTLRRRPAHSQTSRILLVAPYHSRS